MDCELECECKKRSESVPGKEGRGKERRGKEGRIVHSSIPGNDRVCSERYLPSFA